MCLFCYKGSFNIHCQLQGSKYGIDTQNQMYLSFLNYQLETFLCIDFNVFTVGRDYIWETVVVLLMWCKLIIRTDNSPYLTQIKICKWQGWALCFKTKWIVNSVYEILQWIWWRYNVSHICNTYPNICPTKLSADNTLYCICLHRQIFFGQNVSPSPYMQIHRWLLNKCTFRTRQRHWHSVVHSLSGVLGQTYTNTHTDIPPHSIELSIKSLYWTSWRYV